MPILNTAAAVELIGFDRIGLIGFTTYAATMSES